MRRILRVAALMLPSLLTACAYSVHNVHVSGYEPYRPESAGKVVSAHTEQFVILGFKGDTDYVDRAYEDLQSKCPRGEIVGIVTEYQTALGFFSWTHHIYMKGLCTSSGPTKSSSLEDDEFAT